MLIFPLDPSRKPPPPLNSPTKPKAAAPTKQQPPMFNPSDVLNKALKKTKISNIRIPAETLPPPPPPPPSEPDWAPREYLEKGENYFIQ